MNISIEWLVMGLALTTAAVVFLMSRYNGASRKARKEALKQRIELRRQIAVLKKDIKKKQNQVEGLLKQVQIQAKVSSKLSERAFNLSSSANLAVMHLQKSLAVRPAFVPRKKQIANESTQNQVINDVGGAPEHSGFDWLYPVLSEEERELLDNAVAYRAKLEK